MGIFVPKDDKIRQQILKHFVIQMEQYAADNETTDMNKVKISVSDLIAKLKISEESFDVISAPLIPQDEIQFRTEQGIRMVLPDNKTGEAYYSNKYLKERRKTRVDAIKDFLTIVVSAIAIISAIGSIIVYTTTIKDIKTEVNQLKEGVKEMRMQQHPENLRMSTDSAKFNSPKEKP